MKWISSKEAADAWQITERRVNELCSKGRIEGAIKKGRFWAIPENAAKPIDGRYLNSGQRRQADLPLPIGVSDYGKATVGYYYVDKTLMLKKLMDERAEVCLFTRSRRFGKTLNMSMIASFFEKRDEDTSHLFCDRLIWKEGKKYRQQQGSYPVVYLTFKEIRKGSWTDCYESICNTIANEFARHRELADSPLVSNTSFYHKIVDGTASRDNYERSLLMLTQLLHEHHGKKAIVIIDEYDTPIQEGHFSGYYNEIISFMRNLFSGAFKDNFHLQAGYLSGILKTANESIFSGLNNLAVYTILDDDYSQYFGFTRQEVEEIASYYGKEDRLDEIEAWYDGYTFGNTRIYNPWSVVNYFMRSCTPKSYWISTSSNDVIAHTIASTDREVQKDMQDLLSGRSVQSPLDLNYSYRELGTHSALLYSLLCSAGYLTVASAAQTPLGELYCLHLPNREIEDVFKTEILDRFSPAVPRSFSLQLSKAIAEGNVERIKVLLGSFLLRSVSFHDTWREGFYHGLVLGLCALFAGYEVTSNREEGDGRYDIQLKPLGEQQDGIIIEVKDVEKASNESLSTLAAKAVAQILDKRYATGMQQAGIRKIICIGIAFSGKDVELSSTLLEA